MCNEYFENHFEVLRYMPTVINQEKIHNFFITGKEGTEKTSFVKYLSEQSESLFQMIPVYINTDGHNTLDELIELLIEEIFGQLNKEKIMKFFSSNEDIAVKENKIIFNEDLIKNAKKDFASFLIGITQMLDENKKGFFIVIDDIDGIANDLKFTGWYKSFSERIAFYGEKIPVSFTLVSHIETFDKLIDLNPLFTRIFKLIRIDV